MLLRPSLYAAGFWSGSASMRLLRHIQHVQCRMPAAAVLITVCAVLWKCAQGIFWNFSYDVLWMFNFYIHVEILAHAALFGLMKIHAPSLTLRVWYHKLLFTLHIARTLFDQNSSVSWITWLSMPRVFASQYIHPAISTVYICWLQFRLRLRLVYNMMQDLRCIVLPLEVHIKWFGRRCNVEIKNSIPALRHRPSYFKCTSNHNATQCKPCIIL